MLVNSEVRIHPSIDTVLCARFLGSIELVGRNLSGDAFLEAHFGEVVDSLWIHIC